MGKKKVVISQGQRKAIERMEEGENLFITGNAGTGKSTILRQFLLETKRQCVVLAPTGVAAMNVGGSTIHSFFKLPFGFLGHTTPRTMRNAKGLNRLDTIIIDEISMVRADILDMVDKTLRFNLKNRQPFGGLQVIFFGDLMQLPPVVQNEELGMFDETYGGYYFFHTPAFMQADVATLQLEEIFRQKDVSFIELLNEIRNQALTPKSLAVFNSKVRPLPPKASDDAIVLTARNFEADQINETNLRSLPGAPKVYKADLGGDFKESDAPSPIQLKLKIGARVMVTKNDPSEDKAFVNGSLGTVVELKSNAVVVELEDGEVELTYETWEQSRYEFDGVENEWNTVVVGSYKQIPLKLAWAITIHKSQGKTFEKVWIDLGVRAFAHGQTYVAFSRCTSLAGVELKRPLRFSDVILDPQVKDFLTRFGG